MLPLPRLAATLLDLTDPATLTALGSTAQEMTGTWVTHVRLGGRTPRE